MAKWKRQLGLADRPTSVFTAPGTGFAKNSLDEGPMIVHHE
jgi:hypothetical protein